jgi:hypothetical protein
VGGKGQFKDVWAVSKNFAECPKATRHL